MMPCFRLPLLLWCGALCWSPAVLGGIQERPVPEHHSIAGEMEESDRTLEDEMDNQENILSQLLGDYDKVKTVSEGSDCRCKCVVKPLSREACKRLEDGSAKAEDFYTVETVTSGPECKKCICIAPPSALNPCEGDYRFRKLQQAGKDELKLSTIMDLLEGASYGMDLLKLHSITTKLLERVDNMEKSFSGNVTKEKGSVRGEKAQGKVPRSHHRLEKKRRLNELETSLPDKAAAAFSHAERKYEEKFVRVQGSSRSGLKRNHLEGSHYQKPAKPKPGPNGMSIRSMTFYKAEVEEDDGEHSAGRDDVLTGDSSVDLIIEDQIPEQQSFVPTPLTGPLTTVTMSPALAPKIKTPKQREPPTETLRSQKVTPTSSGWNGLSTTSSSTTTKQANVLSIEVPPTVNKTSPNSTTLEKNGVRVKSRLNWDEGPSESTTELLKNSGVCKDTLATISDPVTHNTYGRSEGAWMKDPKGNGNVIYVTNYYFGSNLLEFRDMDTFKQGRFSNSYKLPYNWIGTGHVVYNGAFFYNRAFSRDIIKYDLRLRYVAAWTTLHDAVFGGDEETEEEELAPRRWRGHSDMDFAVDESGLWMVYPALDEEGFHQELVVLTKLNPNDLQKENTWRTGLRRNFYGNTFVICGVLYAVDGYASAHANISYAFDTHTHTQMAPRLPFVNNYTYTTQIDYNPKERTLYAWDNGHQVTYDVIFAY